MNMMDGMERVKQYDAMGLDLTQRLAMEHKRIIESTYQEYKHQKELKEMEDRLYKRIIDKFSVEVKNEALLEIKELNKEIDKLLKGK